MADVALPGMATVNPGAGDTVVGVQGGQAKRFPVGTGSGLAREVDVANAVQNVGGNLLDDPFLRHIGPLYAGQAAAYLNGIQVVRATGVILASHANNPLNTPCISIAGSGSAATVDRYMRFADMPGVMVGDTLNVRIAVYATGACDFYLYTRTGINGAAQTTVSSVNVAVSGYVERDMQIVVPAGVEGLSIRVGKRAENPNEVLYCAASVSLGTVKALEERALPRKEVAAMTAFEAVVQDNSVTPKKTNFFELTRNLYNYRVATPGYYATLGGSVLVNASYFLSDYIDVVPGTQYVANETMRFVTAFNSLGAAVSGSGVENASTYTVPAGIVRVRVSVAIAKLEAFQFEVGSVSTGFVGFGYQLSSELPDGTPVLGGNAVERPYEYGLARLREARQRSRRILNGDSNSTLTIAAIGDSWSQNHGRWPRPAFTALSGLYGDGGDGWISFGRYSASDASANGSVKLATIPAFTGTWSWPYLVATNSPDLASAVSSVATSTLSWAFDPAGLAYTMKLYAEGGSGAVRYRFGAGAWTDVDLSALAAGLQVVTVSGVPLTAQTFELEIVSGSVTLYGMTSIKSAGSFVSFHKLGASGARASHWAAADATQWQAGISALAPDIATIMLGTNDQTIAVTAEAYKSQIATIIDRLRAARPAVDILLIAPCENMRGLSPAMLQYADALFELAQEKKVAFLDLQPYFGDSPAEYSSAGIRPWFNADGIHPEPTSGGRAIVDAVLRVLTQSV